MICQFSKALRCCARVQSSIIIRLIEADPCEPANTRIVSRSGRRPRSQRAFSGLSVPITERRNGIPISRARGSFAEAYVVKTSVAMRAV